MLNQLRRVAVHRGLQVSAFRGLRCISGWATVDPRTLSGSNPGRAQNLVAGRWKDTAASETVVDPLNGEEFLQIPDTSEAEVQEFVDAARSCPKTGLHNPLKNPERYQLISNVCNAAGQKLRDEETLDFFTRLVQRVSPKSYSEAQKEVVVTRKFLENFASDNGRFLARSFGVPGDHAGQESRGYRFPYGHVGLVLPFNFPIEIPVLQLMGALLMGNRPTLKIDSKVSIVIEQFLRMCVAECGLPAQDADLLHASGPVTQTFLEKAKPRTLLFTGSSKVSEKLFQVTGGKMRTEDAGFDWKVLGPDGPRDETDTQYVAWQCDQDAYACSGQKCSAQSVLFAHTKWSRDSALLDTMGQLAGRRRLDDLTVGPVLTWTTEAMLEHANKLAALPGAEVLFGGKELYGGSHSVPKRYGLIEPTAVKVPLEVFASEEHFELCTTEVFGPMQVVVEWGDGPDDEDRVLECLERMEQHLTAAVVSRDMDFQNRILQSTVNGTTYTGIRARTTGAPQNHWFGPSGDPRGAGIGTPEAIQLVWSHHREIIHDQGPLPENWTLPEAT